MGANCSNRSKSSSHWISFLGVDYLDRVQVLDSLKIKPGQAAKQLPSTARIIDEISFHQSWLFGGRSPIRPLVQRVLKNTDGLVYIVDSTNEDKLQDELSRLDKHILQADETQNFVVMILAKIQEEEGAFSLKEIEFKVREILSTQDPKLGGRTVFLRGFSSETKVGLKEAFSQFDQIIQLHKGRQITPGLQTFTGDELEAFGKKDNNSRLHSLKKMFDMSYMKSILLY